MRVFKKGNWDVDRACPICGTKKEGEVVLVGISGTESDGIMKGLQVHLECLDPIVIYADSENKRGIIIQRFENKEV